MRTLVAVATTAERAALLPRSLGSLRKQCDLLHVYLNGHADVPECVLDLADAHVRAAVNGGADRKFFWAHEHDGIHLSCDDDFVYPPDYVARMAAAVLRFEGRALVTAHGRTYPPHPTGMADRVRSAMVRDLVPDGAWVNYAGTGVLAWDATRIQVPRSYPTPNRTDVQLSAWANRESIPIWVVPHTPDWLKPIQHQGGSISADSRSERHATNNALLRAHGEWKLHELESR